MIQLKPRVAKLLRRIPKGAISLVVCVAFAWQAWEEADHHGAWRHDSTWRWDIEAYYHYLPATVIHGDVGDLEYVGPLDRQLHPSGEPYMFAIPLSPETGRRCIKYAYGTALFELPGFLIAHAYATSHWSTWKADGYSLPYQLAIPIGTIAFVTCGLLLLRRFVRRYCGDTATAAALCTLAFGTNLWCYTALDAGMSHAYQFFLFAVVLDATDRWHRRPGMGTAAVIGGAIGWAIAVRPVDGLIVLVPVCWNMWPAAAARAKWDLVRSHWNHTVIGLSVAVLFIIPQLAYWKYATGSYLFYSYGGETILLTEPHVIDGLFSFRKGWFVYSPLLLIGVAGMMLMLRDRGYRAIAIASLACLVPMVYVVFCWWQWWYGGGFGSRPLVPALALFALPMALVAERMRQRKWTSIAAVLVVYLGVSLNLFQTRQYNQTLIHWSDMSFERYRTVWGVQYWSELSKEDTEGLGK